MLRQSVRTFLSYSSRSRESLGIRFGHLRGYHLPMQHGLENLSMIFGRYETEFMSCLRKQCLGARVAYDIGANFGYSSLIMANALGPQGRVYAFEPSPRVYESLVSTVGLNSLNGAVTPLQMAVSSEVGTASFVMVGGHTQGLLDAAAQGQATDSHSRVEVSTTTLDQLVFVDEKPTPGILKIDVEGGESLVLQGARRVLSEIRPRILLELHGRQRADEVWDLLAGQRYVWNEITNGQSQIESKDKLSEKFKSRWTVRHFCLLPRERT